MRFSAAATNQCCTNRRTWPRSGRQALPAWHMETTDRDEQRNQTRTKHGAGLLEGAAGMVRRLRIRALSACPGPKMRCAWMHIEQSAVLYRSNEPALLATEPLLLGPLRPCFA